MSINSSKQKSCTSYTGFLYSHTDTLSPLHPTNAPISKYKYIKQGSYPKNTTPMNIISPPYHQSYFSIYYLFPYLHLHSLFPHYLQMHSVLL